MKVYGRDSVENAPKVSGGGEALDVDCSRGILHGSKVAEDRYIIIYG